MEKVARVEYKPTKEEFDELEFFATITMMVFKYDSAKTLEQAHPGYDDYVVDEYREHRYSILRKGKKVIVSMRGSNNGQNWSDGFTSHLVYDDVLEARVHSGYSEVAKGVADRLSQYCDEQDEIYLTGGSMGGATSTLIGWYLDNRGYNVQKIWAFAPPRVSDGDYGHLPIVSVLDTRDPVVLLPAYSIWKRYRHQGKRLVLHEGTWYMYEDSWRTDLLTSSMFLVEAIDSQTHAGYADALYELKDKLGY